MCDNSNILHFSIYEETNEFFNVCVHVVSIAISITFSAVFHKTV